MHFYGIEPENTPLWKLSILEKSHAALAAEQTLRLATALRMARAKPDQFRRYVRELQQQAKPRRRRAFGEVQVAMIRPEQVAWFEANHIPYALLDD